MKSDIKNREIWNITYPIMVGMLSQTLITLVDTAFLGRLGEVELGAASMAGIYYYFFTTLAWGFAIGVQIIVARRFGEGLFDRISVVMRHGMLFMALFSLILFSVIALATDWVMLHFVSSHGVYEVAVEFIEYRKYGILFAAFNFLFRSFYIGISNTKSITYSTILMTIVNIVFNTILIFGTPLTPALGVAGAAIASVLAELSALILFTLYTTFTQPVGIKIFSRFKFETELMSRILNLSIPTMFQKFISFGSWLAFFLIIEKLGERALAVTMVCRSVYMLLGIPVFSFSATANTLTSRLIGEGKRDMVRPTLIKIWKFSALCLLPLALIVAIFPQYCLMVYTNSPEIISDSISILLLAVVTQYAMGAGMIYFEASSGTGNTHHAMILEAAVLAIYLSVAWITAICLQASLVWVWTAETAYGLFCFIFCYTYIAKYKWWSKKI